jgi:hypothetical protein
VETAYAGYLKAKGLLNPDQVNTSSGATNDTASGATNTSWQADNKTEEER